MNINLLFDGIYYLTFILSDGSQIRCKTTLNSDILHNLGYANVDGFVDLLSGRVIPEDMFTFDFVISSLDSQALPRLDSLFQDGGKVHWKLAN